MFSPKVRSSQAYVLSLILLSCDQSFAPRADIGPQPLIFSILSTDRDAQFVRSELTYLPPGSGKSTGASGTTITDALVTLDDGIATYRFRDTLLPRPDASPPSDPVHTFVLHPFTLTRGISYTISVQSPRYGTASGSASVPTKPAIALGASGESVLENPGSKQDDDPISFALLLGGEAKGYIARLILDYSVFEDGEWSPHRAEVLVKFTYFGLDDFSYVEYGRLTHRPTTHHTTIAYLNKVYTATLIDILYKRFPTAKIVFNRAVFSLLQAEQNLYDYFLVAHAYNDPHSMRLDQPIYSNITGGIGLVGAYSLDSITYTYPTHFAFNRR